MFSDMRAVGQKWCKRSLIGYLQYENLQHAPASRTLEHICVTEAGECLWRQQADPDHSCSAKKSFKTRLLYLSRTHSTTHTRQQCLVYVLKRQEEDICVCGYVHVNV